MEEYLHKASKVLKYTNVGECMLNNYLRFIDKGIVDIKYQEISKIFWQGKSWTSFSCKNQDLHTKTIATGFKWW